MRRRVIVWSLSVCVAMTMSSAVADDAKDASSPLADRVAELSAEYRQKRPFGALAVGVISRGRRQTWGFGEIGDGEQKKAVDGGTLFEIGSCPRCSPR